MDDEELAWWHEVNEICLRFLDLPLESIEDVVDGQEAFEGGITPEEFFLYTIVPSLKLEVGDDYIDGIIGEVGMWGIDRPSLHLMNQR